MTKAPLLVVAGVVLLFAGSLVAADEPSVESEMKALISKVNEKIKAGVQDEKAYTGELKEFDAIEARHSSEKTDAVAQVLLMKAALYLEVLDEPSKAVEVLKQVQAKYPGTKPGAAAGQMLASAEKQEASAKIRASLKEGAPFPPFDEKDMSGKPFSLAAFKGKVVLVDFWATWCGPCVGELPNVIAAYEKYHDKGFVIAGISLDEDKSTLESFLKEKKMTWPQYFDGKGWQNKLAVNYGVNSIPCTYLLDGKGVIIGRDLRGEALVAAVAKAVGAN